MISLGFHYEACNEADKMDFEKAIETIAVAFSSKWVSDTSWLYQTATIFLIQIVEITNSAITGTNTRNTD